MAGWTTRWPAKFHRYCLRQLSTEIPSRATLVAAIRVASSNGGISEAHELPERQPKTGGSQERKSLGVPVARSATGRVNPAEAYRHRHTGRTAHRIISPSCGGRDPLRDQPTNLSTACQERQLRHPRKSLPPTRVTGCVQQNQ